MLVDLSVAGAAKAAASASVKMADAAAPLDASGLVGDAKMAAVADGALNGSSSSVGGGGISIVAAALGSKVLANGRVALGSAPPIGPATSNGSLKLYALLVGSVVVVTGTVAAGDGRSSNGLG